MVSASASRSCRLFSLAVSGGAIAVGYLFIGTNVDIRAGLAEFGVGSDLAGVRIGVAAKSYFTAERGCTRCAKAEPGRACIRGGVTKPIRFANTRTRLPDTRGDALTYAFAASCFRTAGLKTLAWLAFAKLFYAYIIFTVTLRVAANAATTLS